MKTKISVIIPLYNKEKSIQRAISSVLNQSEQDFELVIVNDGSTDQSAVLVENLLDNDKIRLFHQENAGVSAARNRGVVEACSDLIAFLDADDEWRPEFLGTILKLHTQFPTASVFGTLYSIQYKEGLVSLPKVDPFFHPGYEGPIENYLSVIRSVLPFNSSSFALTKKAFQEIGGFPVGIKFGEDVDTFIRLSIRFTMVFKNEALVIYHHDAENRACDQYYHPTMLDYYPITNLVHRIRNEEIPQYLRQSAIEYVAKYQLNFANIYLHNGHPREAKALIITCIGTKIYIMKWVILFLCTLIPPYLLLPIIKIWHHIRG